MRGYPMDKNMIHQSLNRRRLVVIAILLTALLPIVIVKTLMAQANGVPPADITASVKTASISEVFPGNNLRYTVMIENSGGDSAQVVMTDTLPMGLTFIPNSLTVSGDRGMYGEGGGVITWTDTVAGSELVKINFSASVSDTMPVGYEINNSIQISGANTLITRTAVTTVVSETHILFPIIMKPFPTLSLSLISPPNVNNEWTVGWTTVQGTTDVKYEVQEDTSPSFANPQTWMLNSSTNTLAQSKTASWHNMYFYRVRATWAGLTGEWSNTLVVVGNYNDIFDTASSGWSMRRQDKDDINQTTFYENGHFVIRILGRWDYLLAAPMRPAPAPPYAIETRVRLRSLDNLHTYGIVFGGDWNGNECPSQKNDSCFNQYYRLLVIWSGAEDTLKFQLKRIDFHDNGNQGRGEGLIDWKDVRVNKPSKDYQIWGIEVYPDGLIKVFVNGSMVGSARDTTYINDRYFGGISATNEYAGLRTEFDWYKVRSLLP